MNTLIARTLVLLLLAAPALHAQGQQLIKYQGRVGVNGANFDGTGLFKFAIVNVDGTISFWSNDGTSTAGSEPAAADTLTVTGGRYSVLWRYLWQLTRSSALVTLTNRPTRRRNQAA